MDINNKKVELANTKGYPDKKESKLRLKHSIIPKEYLEKYPVWDEHLFEHTIKIYI